LKDWIEESLTPHPAQYIGHFGGGLRRRLKESSDGETLIAVVGIWFCVLTGCRIYASFVLCDV